GGDDDLDGGVGNDTLYGGAGQDVLKGGLGNDALYGEDGNDILIGGVGNDYLSGDAGSDVYRFERGWGQDTVYNYDTSTSKVDAIEFGADIAVSDVAVTRSGDHLILSLKGSTDQITVQSYFNGDAAGSYRLEEVRFADGTAWNIAQVKALVQQGTDGNDILYGYAVADTISGGAGNDTINGYGGDDDLDGGVGNDTLYGGAGQDVLKGGLGNDTLYGEDGNDTLIGGAGNDYLSGGVGSDVYRFERGWGQDTVYNYDTSTSKVDAIEFGADIAASDIVATRSGDDLILRLKDSTDQITVQSYFNGDAAGSYRLEEVRFADGTAWNIAQVKALVQQGTDGNDILYGYAVADTISGGAGNDTINGYGGDDDLDGGVGNDTLYGGAGQDVLKGGLGNDTLYGDDGNDQLLGNEGDDRIFGANGNDTLIGGAGNDYLSGDAGSDVYRFERGWGQDTVYNYDTSTSKVDAIEFGADIAASDIMVTRFGDYLILRLKDSTDQITVQSYFNGDAAGSYRLEEVRFADGTAWNIAQVKALAQQGTDGNDILYGYAVADTISGGAGNDTINGYGGDDDLDGGVGNDTLYGGAGQDVLKGGLGND
ncbi:calcium-binding protein, partial [Pseudomonas triclosanedens]